jgi:polar amino acid transport system substrate-binding protein
VRKLFLFVVIGVLLVSILPGCGQETLKVRIATDATWPPFEYVDEQTMDIVGFDIDLIKAIADEAGLDIEIINVGWDPLLAGMAQCQYDAAISAMTITDERKEVMLFSNPYFEAGQLVTVQFGNTDIASKEDLGGKTVGAQIGTTGSFEVEKIAGATLKTYDDIGLAMQDLMNGQIDAVIADNPLAMGYANANPDKLKTVGAVFTSEYYGIAVCKSKPELLDRINEGLAKVKAEGLIDELILKWLAN